MADQRAHLRQQQQLIKYRNSPVLIQALQEEDIKLRSTVQGLC